MNKKIIKDFETGEEFTIEELKKEYFRLKDNCQTEAENFEDYLINITDKNGSCKWI